ncbi:hypothetical protein BHM03_00032828 [Ensete ventricosum]|nr:hypothetical protein BHM03_00032828 [Ensete ventricosum]
MILWRRQRLLVQCNKNRATSASFTIAAKPPLPTIKVPSLPAPSPLIGNGPNTISSPHCCLTIASHRHVRVPPTPCFLVVVTRIAVVFFVHHARTFLCIQSALPGRCCVLPWVSVLVGLWCRPETDGDGDQHGDRYRFVACNMLDRDETKAKLGPSTGGAALAFEATEETDVEPVEAPNHTGEEGEGGPGLLAVSPIAERRLLSLRSPAYRSGWEMATEEGRGSEAHCGGEGGAAADRRGADDLVELRTRVSRGSSSVAGEKATEEAAQRQRQWPWRGRS